MIGVSASLSQNAYSPSNDTAGRAYVITPKNFALDNSMLGAVFCHGAGGSEADAWSGGSGNLKRILQTIARMNPMVAPAFTSGGDKWGNSVAVLQVNDAVTFIGAQGARTDKVLLIARSMGQLYAMNWARQNPSKVAGIVSFEGVADLEALEATGSFSSIDTAYGGAYSDATHGATYDPSNYAQNGDLDGIPIRLYYATDDTTVPAATVTTLASYIDTATAISMGTGGHSDAPLANVDVPDLLDWIEGLT